MNDVKRLKILEYLNVIYNLKYKNIKYENIFTSIVT